MTKKRTLLALLCLITFVSLSAQTTVDVVQNGDFSDWTGGVPDHWNGPRTSIGTSNINEYTDAAYIGSSSCQLVRTSTSHARFTNQPFSILADTEYTVTYYARGKGEIRNAFYRNGAYSGYSEYTILDTDVWTQIVWTFSFGSAADDAEVIFSVRNTDAARDHLQIDGVSITYEADDNEVISPEFTPLSGTYYPSVEVTITSETEGAAIKYSLVSEEGAWLDYTEALNVTETTTIWAYATKEEMTDSPVVSATYTIPVPAMTTLPYTENFTTDLGDCAVHTVAGTNPWYHWSGSATGNGFGGEALEEHWLILPGINFNSYDDVAMTFTNYAQFGVNDENNYLKLFYSANYAGLGDPYVADWNELTFDQPTGNIGTTELMTQSGVIDLSEISGESLYLAFKYYSTNSPTRWRVDDINIFEALNPLMFVSVDNLTGFSYLEGEGPTASQNYLLSALNLEPATGNIVVSGNDYFEVSLDDETYSATLNIPYTDGALAETTVYVRLKATLAVGDYLDQQITNIGGGAEENVTVSGSVSEQPPAGYFIDFETDTSGTKGSYATGTVMLSGLEWEMTEALIGNLAGDKKNGARSARMRRNGEVQGEMVMLEDKTDGIGTISFVYARYGTEIGQPNLTIQYSTNQGTSWIDLDTISDFPAELTDFSAEINVAGSIRIRFVTDLSGTNQRRLNIDDILMTDYDVEVEEPFATETKPIVADTNILTDLFEDTSVMLGFDEVTVGGDVTVSYFLSSPESPSFTDTTPTNVSIYRWVIGSDIEFLNGWIHINPVGLPGVNIGALTVGQQNLNNGIVIFKRANVGDDFVALDTYYDEAPGQPGMLSGFAGNSFSEFVLGSSNEFQTLPVELSSFTATVTANRFVELQWVAETETNMLGYHVYRNTIDSLDEAVRVNRTIIPANNSSNQQLYKFTDDSVNTEMIYYYWLESNDLDLSNQFHGPISVFVEGEADDSTLPSVEYKTELIGAYPNPFNPSTQIHFTLAKTTNVTISIYNVRGQKMKALVSDELLNTGKHSIVWDGKDSYNREAASGIYYYRMETPEYLEFKKMLLLK